MKSMGMTAYRFSLSWSRIMPLGYGAVNDKGIQHYNNLINLLVTNGIEPIVTLYHWDLPLGLEEKYGGWLSPKIEDDFIAYANICFSAFGDRVKKWLTINEPWTFCFLGYVAGGLAPGRCSDRSKCTAGDSASEGYIAAHNVLNSHAAAVELYRKLYKTWQRGEIGIALNQDWGEPLTDSPEDIEAALRKNEFSMAWFGDPIVFGRYPQSMIDRVGDRLLKFTPKQIDRLKGSYDFWALNHYSTKYVSAKPIEGRPMYATELTKRTIKYSIYCTSMCMY